MSVARITATALLTLAVIAAAIIPATPCLAATARTAAALVYAGAGLVCHQRPERSFATCGRSWPVCGRCSGLYLGAAAGALLAAFGLGRGRRPRWWQRAIGGAALVVAASWLVEAIGLVDPGTPLRFALALPLGITISSWLGEVAREAGRP